MIPIVRNRRQKPRSKSNSKRTRMRKDLFQKQSATGITTATIRSVILMSRKRSFRLFLALATFLGLIAVIFNGIIGINRFGNTIIGGKGSPDAFLYVHPDAQPFNQNNVATQAKNLIMVAGHSVIVSGHLKDADVDEKDWYLLDYQKGQGLPQAMLGHIRAGIQEAARDPESLLIFSGGETRPNTGPVNEGSSYFRVADAMDLWNEPRKNDGFHGKEGTVRGHGKNRSIGDGALTVRARSITEEFATDSFQNLLFSICRFKEVTGSYPEKITVASFSFKKRRFEELHSKALRWPSTDFHYIGYDPDKSTGFDLQKASEGEQNNAARPFETDMYGCNTKLLQEKRMQRNPFSRTPPYELSCPEMKGLLTWCGPGLIPADLVPWVKR